MWGRSEGNRESDARKHWGNCPTCELVGWLNVEAQGHKEGNNGLVHTTSPSGRWSRSFQPL